MGAINHFRVLGITAAATAAEMKSAYRKRCLETHPDHGGKQDAFDEVTTAYAVLSDPTKRREWELAYLEQARVLGHFVCPSCFAINRIRALAEGEAARCAVCKTHLETSPEMRDVRYKEALRAQVSDLLLTLGAETGSLAKDAVVAAANGIRRRFGITRGR